MQLTTELLERFLGGELEIQSYIEGYVFRGKIDGVVVEDDVLKVLFLWLAKNDGGPFGGSTPPSSTWKSVDDLEYELGLTLSAASEISDGRIALNSMVSSETLVFFPPGGSTLNLSNVKGLEHLA